MNQAKIKEECAKLVADEKAPRSAVEEAKAEIAAERNDRHIVRVKKQLKSIETETDNLVQSVRDAKAALKRAQSKLYNQFAAAKQFDKDESSEGYEGTRYHAKKGWA